MQKLKIMYLPIGVPTFHMPSAQAMFDSSISLFSSMDIDLIAPKVMLLSVTDLSTFMMHQEVDMVIVQHVTFANSAYMTEILKQTKAPIVLWTLREPVIDGGRLRLNSLTGAFSSGYAYQQMRGKNLLTLIGSPDEAIIKRQLKEIISALSIKMKMRSMSLLVVGHTPEGFGFGRALDLDMASTFGVTLKSIEAREFMNIAKQFKDDDTQKEHAIAHQKMLGLDQIEEHNQRDFIRLFKAYQDYIDNNHIGAIASRCWPDFFTEYKTPVCGVLGLLNDRKIAAACEADAYGALSMYVGQELTQTPTYLGDPVSIDEIENTITFWHCGTAACSLARKETGAQTGVHPNRKIGPTMEFGLRPHPEATIFRIGRLPNGTFRFFVSEGVILDKPQQFLGTSVVVKVKHDVHPMITKMIEEGWEPHYVIIYGNVKQEIMLLGKLLNIETYQY